MPPGALAVLAACVVIAGGAYYVLVLVAAWGFRRRRSRGQPLRGVLPSFSVLKPLAGAEPGLSGNLESFFRLECPDHELLFAAREDSDPALVLARSLGARHSGKRTRAISVGEPPCANAKVHSLAQMTRIASGDVLVISDSDILAKPTLLRDLASEFQDESVGVVTCPYRAEPGRSLWSRLEGLGMNTEFWSGVLVAQMLAPMDFAVGPTMAVRRSCLESIGGWDAFGDYLAEDFQIGRRARQAGFDVRLSTHVVAHRIGSATLAANFAHRLRWRRSTRRSRPAGYWGELLANPLPWTLVLLPAASWAGWSWWVFGACLALRFAAAVAVGRVVLGDRLVIRRWWLVPIQDLLSLAMWFAGLFGRRIAWRDREYELTRDGRMRRVGVSRASVRVSREERLRN